MGARSTISFVAIAAAISACTRPATEVLVSLGTDAPEDRALTIRVQVDAASMPATAAGGTHVFVRGGAIGDTQLPGSFAVVPSGTQRDQPVTLRIDAQLEATATAPALVFRRTARFAFIPNVTAGLPIFLNMSCAAAAVGCNTVSPDLCTASVRCEEQGQTCGDRGECVPVDVMPIPIAHGGNTDAGVDVAAADVVDGGVVSLPAPHVLAPLAGSRLGTRRARLSWVTPAGAQRIQGRLCDSHDCLGEQHGFATRDEFFDAPLDLHAGVWFWQVSAWVGSDQVSPWSPLWTFRIPPTENAASTAVVATGMDFDGDGHDDIAVSAPLANSSAGAIHLYRGGAAFDPAPVRTLTGEAAGQRFGDSLSNGGDVNGDGFADLIVSSFQETPRRVRIYAGNGTPALVDATPMVTLATPAGPTSHFGSTTAALGDVNGDGYGDIAIADNQSGMVLYVYYGSAHGPNAVADVTITAPSGGTFGVEIAESADVNGDGFADLVVGDFSGFDAAGVWVYLGSSAGLSTAVATHTDIPTGQMEFGRHVANAGDVNGDGRSDIVAADAANQRVYLYLGTPTGITPSPQATLSGSGAFGTALAGIGDFDHDGFDDVAVGSPVTNMNEGRIDIFRGSATSGLVGPVFGLAGPDGVDTEFGMHLAPESDLDGNGYPELLVGAPMEMGLTGRAFLLSSDAAGFSMTPWRTIDAVDGTGSYFCSSLR